MPDWVRTSATWTSTDIIKDHRTTTILTSTMATTRRADMRRIINTISTSMFCLLIRSQKQPSGNDFWSRKFYERMRFISSVVILCSYRRCLMKLLLSRQTPTQLTVPFDSSVLEGAFAGVNIFFITMNVPARNCLWLVVFLELQWLWAQTINTRFSSVFDYKLHICILGDDPGFLSSPPPYLPLLEKPLHPVEIQTSGQLR